MTRRLLAVLLAGAVALGACSIETAGAPKGDVTLVATFDDVQDLTPGHNVQASNVVVGSVRKVALDGYRARVEISIVDDFRVPAGVSAVIRRTSLLGEYYVDLVLPERFDVAAGPFLGDGDTIAEASTQPDVEQLAERAAQVVGGLTADDLRATIDAAATGLAGRGPALNQLVQDAGSVASALADQQAAITATLDAMAELGTTLAPESGAVAATIDQLTTASGTLAESRDRIVAATEALVDLAITTNDTVLEPHAERLAALLRQAQPLLGSLAARTDVLEGLIVDLDRFVALFPSAVHNGTVLLHTWAFVSPEALEDTLGSILPLDVLEQLLGGTP